MDIKKFGIVGLLIALVIMSCVPAFAQAEETVSVELDETWQLEDGTEIDFDEVEIEINDEVVDITQDNPNPRKAHFVNTLTLKLINFFMEKFGLDENNTIGDLISALVDDNEQLKEERMDELGAETEQELHEALMELKLDRLRDLFSLDASYSDQEVLEYAQEAKIEEVKSLLGLDEDASQEEVNEALQDWREENHLLMGLNKFWKGFF